MTGEPPATDTIGSRIRAGVAWKAVSQFTVQLSRIIVVLVLARMLSLHDWGLAAEVLVFSGFVVVFTDNAFGTALIQRRVLQKGDRSTVFWLSAGVGLALALVGIGLSGPLAAYYNEPRVQPLFAAVSVGFLISALGSTQAALLARDMRWRRLELRQIAATMVGAVAGITIALKGYGPWAIVGQQLVEATMSTVLLWCLSPWRPSLRFSGASLSKLGSFAGYVFGENLLYQAGRNLGVLVMGGFLKAPAVGAFALATNVILVPFTRFAAPLQQVFFPAFSRMSGDRERIADVWIRASRLIAMLAMPALVGLAIVAPEFVDVFFGHGKAAVVPLIQILAWVGIVQSIQTLNGEVLLALNRARTLFHFTAFWFACTLAAFAIGIPWGVKGVAVCYAISTTLVEPVRTYITTRALGIPVIRFVSALSGVAQATAIMGVVLVPVQAALDSTHLPAAAQLAIMVVLGTGAFAAGCRFRAPEVIRELRRALRPSSTPAPAPS